MPARVQNSSHAKVLAFISVSIFVFLWLTAGTSGPDPLEAPRPVPADVRSERSPPAEVNDSPAKPLPPATTLSEFERGRFRRRTAEDLHAHDHDHAGGDEHDDADERPATLAPKRRRTPPPRPPSDDDEAVDAKAPVIIPPGNHADKYLSNRKVLGPRGNVQTCFRLPQFPLFGLEKEILRIYEITLLVLQEMNATAWPTDGTLLGMMREGRVATDRDVDMQIHSTYKQCASMLLSMKPLFEKYAKLKTFKVVFSKNKKFGKIGRYVMVRMYRQHGEFDTGVDFNCVYMDDPQQPTFHVHKGTLEPMPLAVYPLAECVLYDRVVPCPRDGMAVLHALKPRYEGCMAFPHCLGAPDISIKKCLSPHPQKNLTWFVNSTRALHECGYTSLAEHYDSERACRGVAEQNRMKCESTTAGQLCYVQSFKG